MTRRLFSSAQILTALKHAGFEEKRRTPGSHQVLSKQMPHGNYLVTVVVLGKKEVPQKTLAGILELAGMTYDEFLDHAKVKRKGRC